LACKRQKPEGAQATLAFTSMNLRRPQGANSERCAGLEAVSCTRLGVTQYRD
jgi:hypothetical protein